MTLKEARDITEWMAKHGVVQFSLDGLAVQFHPRGIVLPKGAEDPQPKSPERQEDDNAGLLERMIPA